MNIPSPLLENLETIQKKVGYTFKNPDLLALAFIHRSFANENDLLDNYNERLEFLGDAVLGFLIAEELYLKHPTTPEGDLSTMRATLVSAAACAHYVKQLDLGKYLLLGKGEQRNEGRGRDSILADFFEALIGALLLDGDLSTVRQFLTSHFSETMEKLLSQPTSNWKTTLQDWCQKNYQMTPHYENLETNGPDHKKDFRIGVYKNQELLGTGVGSSKKEAQQAAACDAIQQLQNEGLWVK